MVNIKLFKLLLPIMQCISIDHDKMRRDETRWGVDEVYSKL